MLLVHCCVPSARASGATKIAVKLTSQVLMKHHPPAKVRRYWLCIHNTHDLVAGTINYHFSDLMSLLTLLWTHRLFSTLLIYIFVSRNCYITVGRLIESCMIFRNIIARCQLCDNRNVDRPCYIGNLAVRALSDEICNERP